MRTGAGGTRTGWDPSAALALLRQVRQGDVPLGLLREAAASCERHGFRYKVGNVLSSDVFYSANPKTDKWRAMGVIAVEMEASALYMNAAYAGTRALTICTVSDHVLTGEVTTPEQRQTTFTNMAEVALDLI